MYGIVPEYISNKIVKYCISSDALKVPVHGHCHSHGEISLEELVILKQDSYMVGFSYILNILSCLTSCYFYGYLAVVGLDKFE